MESNTLLGQDAARASYKVDNVRWTQYFSDDGMAIHENYWRDPSLFGSRPATAAWAWQRQTPSGSGTGPKSAPRSSSIPSTQPALSWKEAPPCKGPSRSLPGLSRRACSAPSWERIAVSVLSRPGHQTVGSRTVRSPLMWIPQKGEVGAKVGLIMGPQPVMRRFTVAQQGDPHVDDIVGEVAAIRVPRGA